MKDKLDQYIDGIEYLPSTPVLMLKLIDCFRHPETDADEIVKLMSLEPSLTAEVLRRCNSSFFGNQEPVVDVSEALFRLGFYEVYQIALAIFGRQTVSVKQATGVLDVEELWRHCALTAVAARVIAQEVGESEGLVFTAGLLHDVGKVVLACAEGVRYRELLNKVASDGSALADAERAAFGFDHSEVGGRLLSRWGVPDEISWPVARHHSSTPSSPHARLEAVVCLANLMSNCVVRVPAEKPCLCSDPGGQQAMALLQLNPESMTELVVSVRRDMKRLDTLVSGH